MKNARLLRRSLAVSLPVLIGVLALLSLLAPPARALGVSYFVTPGGGGVACLQAAPCTLQTALTNAGNGDFLYVAGGTYVGAGGAVVTLTKSLTLYGGWNGATAGPVVRNATAYPTTLDGQNARRVVYMSGNVTPTLDGFIITRGNATGQIANCTASTPGGCGGGIFAYQAHPIISNNVITLNVALVTATVYSQGHGGGVYLESALRAVVSGNLIAKNIATLVYQGEGGGIQIEGSGQGVVVQNNQVLNNVAPTWGGGISNGSSSPAAIKNNLVQGNQGDLGAGIYEWYGDGRITANRVTGNVGESAMYIGFSRSYIEQNQIVNNATAIGLSLVNGTGVGITVTNNIVAYSGNTSLQAYGYSGGVFTATLVYNTLVGSGTGSGILVDTAFVSLRLTDTLISGHTYGINKVVSTSTVASRFTLFDTNVVTRNVGGSLSFTYIGDPQFLNPAGGDFHIGAASYARDRGTPTFITQDVDGQTRPIGALPDIGADETTLANALWLPLLLK